MGPLRPDQVAFRALYKELVETNTTLSAGSCTLAAQRMAAHLKAAGFSDADVTLYAAPDHPKEGGLVAMGERNRMKAEMLYAAIDASGFYKNPVAPNCRSWMNVPFTLQERSLDGAFLEAAAAAGLTHLEGHRLVGGMRASLYNAMPLAGVQALTAFMKEFERRHG